MDQQKADDLLGVVTKFLDDALEMELNLSSDDVDYDLCYIQQKLALCSTYMERLSDIQLKLTKIGLQVVKVAFDNRNYLRSMERELKASDDYRDQPREQRAHWLQEKTADQREAADSWNSVARVVSEVKSAVADRVQMFKRLDSDIRLHQKLLEAKVAAGATSGSSYTGGKTDELDLNV